MSTAPAMDAALAGAFEATWPAAEYAVTGGFITGRGLGAGGRVSSSRAAGDWSGADIDAAIAVHDRWGQAPNFRVQDWDQALADALAARGLRREAPTAIMAAPLAELAAADIPPVTAFAVWPPMAIQRAIWGAGNISPARQAVMDRVAGPRIALLGRVNDRAGGAGFVAIHQDVAMVHALDIVPDLRRRGLARWMMRQAARWAAANGARRIALAVSRGNTAAEALYRGLGFAEVAGYAYWLR